METILARVRRWGHSFGIVLPKKVMAQQRLREGSEVEVVVRPKHISSVGNLLRWARIHPLKGGQVSETEIRTMKRELWGSG